MDEGAARPARHACHGNLVQNKIAADALSQMSSGLVYSAPCLRSEGVFLCIGDIEAGAVILRTNACILRVSMTRFANVAHICDALVNARRPEHFGRVF
jgi:hypothetical protein